MIPETDEIPKMEEDSPLHLGIPAHPSWQELQRGEVCGASPNTTPLMGPTSPAFTEALINQTLDELLMSPMTATSLGPSDPLLGAGQLPSQPQDIAFIFTKFVEMLDRCLSQTAAKITSDIKMDLQSLGSRIENIENKMDAMIAQANQNTDHIQDLHNQLDVAMAKIYNLENRSRRYNFKIRGLHKSITDISAAHQRAYP